MSLVPRLDLFTTLLEMKNHSIDFHLRRLFLPETRGACNIETGEIGVFTLDSGPGLLEFFSWKLSNCFTAFYIKFELLRWYIIVLPLDKVS